MRLKNAESPVHLSYCTNIHSGDDWDVVFPQLQRDVPKVKAQVSKDGAFGMGLRVSKRSVEQLVDERLHEFKSWMAAEDLYVYTINGFPYGPFHGTTVKEDVYKPDWTEAARLDYTKELIDLAAALNPPDNYATISTVPGTYKQWARGSLPTIADNLIKSVAYAMQVRERTGVTVALCLEPEPCCLLETTCEAIQFFQQWLYTDAAISRLCQLSGCSRNTAFDALHSLIGICYDVCHSAVEFEDPTLAITQLQSAGVPILKIQLSSALRIKEVDNEALGHLAQFNEPVYLHQVVEQKNGKLNRFTDLKDAIQWHQASLKSAFSSVPAMDASSAAIDVHNFGFPEMAPAEWRVHFHVPVYRKDMSHFDTTQDVLKQVLSMQKQQHITPHLEVETYTWDVLPKECRNVSVDQAIARELNWVSEQL